jgi:hypothetical protein
MSRFIKTCLVGAKLFEADGQIEGYDAANIVTPRNFVKILKN